MNAHEIREKILSAKDRPSTAVAVPEWDVTVHVRTMSAADREKIETDSEKGKWRERLLAATLCDSEGTDLFTPADIAALSEKNAAVVVRLARVAFDANEIGESNVEKAKND